MNSSLDNHLQVLKYSYNIVYYKFILSSVFTITGLLHIIRRWYWEEIDAPRRIQNSLKQWMSSENSKREKRKADGADDDSGDDDFEETDSVQEKGVNFVSKEEEEAKRREFQLKNKWYRLRIR